MGLAERRSAKQFADNKYPAIKQELDKAAGFALPIEVKWDELAAEGYEHLYEEAFPKVFFTPLRQALEAITVDEMGKEALQQNLKKVVVRNTGSRNIEFKAGELLFDYDSISNLDYGHERKDELQKVLEKAL